MNLINRLKPTYLLIILILIVVPLVLLLFSLVRSHKEPLPTTPTIVTPSPIAIPTLPPGFSELMIIRAAPIQNEVYLPIQPIEFTFTDSISSQNLKYTVEPFVETEVRQGSIPNSLIIRPVLKWKDGETIVTVLTTTVSDNAKMFQPYVYKMRSTIPPAPEEGGGNY